MNPKPPLPGGEHVQVIDTGPQTVRPGVPSVDLIPTGDGGPGPLLPTRRKRRRRRESHLLGDSKIVLLSQLVPVVAARPFFALLSKLRQMSGITSVRVNLRCVERDYPSALERLYIIAVGPTPATAAEFQRAALAVVRLLIEAYALVAVAEIAPRLPPGPLREAARTAARAVTTRVLGAGPGDRPTSMVELRVAVADAARAVLSTR